MELSGNQGERRLIDDEHFPDLLRWLKLEDLLRLPNLSKSIHKRYKNCLGILRSVIKRHTGFDTNVDWKKLMRICNSPPQHYYKPPLIDSNLIVDDVYYSCGFLNEHTYYTFDLTKCGRVLCCGGCGQNKYAIQELPLIVQIIANYYLYLLSVDGEVLKYDYERGFKYNMVGDNQDYHYLHNIELSEEVNEKVIQIQFDDVNCILYMLTESGYIHSFQEDSIIPGISNVVEIFSGNNSGSLFAVTSDMQVYCYSDEHIILSGCFGITEDNEIEAISNVFTLVPGLSQIISVVVCEFGALFLDIEGRVHRRYNKSEVDDLESTYIFAELPNEKDLKFKQIGYNLEYTFLVTDNNEVFVISAIDPEDDRYDSGDDTNYGVNHGTPIYRSDTNIRIMISQTSMFVIKDDGIIENIRM